MTRILLIEDNEMNRDMLSRRLVRAGYEVITAIDGKSGMATMSAQSPALILMDVRLPDCSGLDLVRKLKRDPETAKIPVIALTAHAMEGDRERAFEAGCEGYDTKPVDLPRLIEHIERLVAALQPGALPPENPDRPAPFST